VPFARGVWYLGPPVTLHAAGRLASGRPGGGGVPCNRATAGALASLWPIICTCSDSHNFRRINFQKLPAGRYCLLCTGAQGSAAYRDVGILCAGEASTSKSRHVVFTLKNAGALV